MKTGKDVRNLRKARGETQGEFAVKLGLSKRGIQEIERRDDLKRFHYLAVRGLLAEEADDADDDDGLDQSDKKTP